MDRILVVDDDPAIVDIISKALTAAGYTVGTAGSGKDAWEKAQTQKWNLIIMDVMMPGMNGILATMRIRENSNVPILILSAKAEGADRVLGLDAGADDYLVKPFDQQELLARVKALLRRYQNLGSIRDAQAANSLTIRDIRLDLGQKQLFVRGEAVHLTATEYKILELLMRNADRVFSAEEIYSQVWNQDAYAVENTVMVHISRIREKLELNPKKPEYLKVVWGIGYVFKAS